MLLDILNASFNECIAVDCFVYQVRRQEIFGNLLKVKDNSV